MAEYKDPVYAFITINPKKKKIEIKGVQSEFKAPAPRVEDFPKDFFHISKLRSQTEHYIINN